jgi:hypothetical protein
MERGGPPSSCGGRFFSSLARLVGEGAGAGAGAEGEECGERGE